MQITNTANMIKVLTVFNPWWRLGAVAREYVKPYKRLAYYSALEILNHRDIRRMIIMSGARRIGKTTILYQIIDHLISSGVDPQHILYLSFDHPILKLCRFDEILALYHDNICGDKDVYYLFDEIQYADNWDAWMKVIYDTQPATQAIATGSASPILESRAQESGTGRWTVLSVPTLSFYEYCQIINLPEISDLPGSMKPGSLISLSRQEQTTILFKLSVFQTHFLRYLQVGGFPELALSSDPLYAQRMLREDVVDKVLKRDIPAIFNLRSVNDLEKIFLYLCYHSAGIINVDAIARELTGVSRPTVEKYISYLESANLIYISKPVEAGGKKVLKAQPKIYIADAAIRNAVIMQDDVLTNPDEMGIMVETAVYKHIRAYYLANPLIKVGYHRMASGKDKEIDVVASHAKGRIYIEVKYREDYHIGEKEAIVQLCDEADCCILVTKRADDFGPLAIRSDKIYRIPAFAFLYLLGHAENNRKYGDVEI